MESVNTLLTDGQRTEQKILTESHHALTVTGSDSKTHQGMTNLFPCTDNTTGVCNSSYWGGEGGGEKGAFKHIKLCSDKLLFASLLQMEELRIFSCICGSSFGSVQLYLSVIKQIQPPCAVEVFPQCKQQREKGKELLLDF